MQKYPYVLNIAQIVHELTRTLYEYKTIGLPFETHNAVIFFLTLHVDFQLIPGFVKQTAISDLR